MTKVKNTAMAHFNPIEFGKRLQIARKALGVTQEELADSISVDRNHITRMERGIRVCSIDLLVELAAALEVSTDYLLMGASSAETAKKRLLTTIDQLTQIAQSL